MATPRDQDWNRFWGREASRRFGGLSWSKQRILRRLVPFAKPGGKALDAGCGSGFFSSFFCDQGMAASALDFSSEALAMAERTTGGRAALIQADLLQDHLHLAQGPFDLIFSDGLLEHFPAEQQDRILTNLHGVLSSDGVLVTVVPNRWSPWGLIRPLYMPGIDETPFILKDLTALHHRNGFIVAEAGGLNVLPWRVSPEFLGPFFGMLLYVVCRLRHPGGVHPRGDGVGSTAGGG